jgi:hypothetical protein
MKYRVVNVYTGYAENSIDRVEEIQVNGDIMVAAQQVEQSNQQWMRDEGEEEHYIQEFFTGVSVIDDIAGVCNGEENTLLVIPATSEWFDRVLDEDSIYDHHMDAWNALIWAQQSAEAPSV